MRACIRQIINRRGCAAVLIIPRVNCNNTYTRVILYYMNAPLRVRITRRHGNRTSGPKRVRCPINFSTSSARCTEFFKNSPREFIQIQRCHCHYYAIGTHGYANRHGIYVRLHHALSTFSRETSPPPPSFCASLCPPRSRLASDTNTIVFYYIHISMSMAQHDIRNFD